MAPQAASKQQKNRNTIETLALTVTVNVSFDCGILKIEKNNSKKSQS